LFISKIALERINLVRGLRLTFRHVISIANSYVPNSDHYFEDKFSYYTKELAKDLDTLLEK
jgi:hypothetical protein